MQAVRCCASQDETEKRVLASGGCGPLTRMSTNAEQEPCPVVGPPTWSYFRDGFEYAAPIRSPAWRRVGVWAVDRLSKHLGDEWPQRTWEKHGQLPGGMALATGHPIAYFELIELGLRLEILSGREGFADLLRPLKQDPREDVVPHVRLELEVGALAAAAGYGVRFERPIAGSTKTSDITIDVDNGESLLVEARVIHQDDRAVAINRFTDGAFHGIQDICTEHEVECTGDLTEVLDDLEFAELLDSVETHARLVRAGGVTPRLLLHGAALQVSQRGAASDKGLRGPALTGDLWPRIADRLDQKARQTKGAKNVWLRIVAIQGLWLFTQWGSLPLADKLATMRQTFWASYQTIPMSTAW